MGVTRLKKAMVLFNGLFTRLQSSSVQLLLLATYSKTRSESSKNGLIWCVSIMYSINWHDNSYKTLMAANQASIVSLKNTFYKPIKTKPKQAYGPLNQQRGVICPKSPFLYHNFDIERHQVDLYVAALALAADKDTQRKNENEMRLLWTSIGLPYPARPDSIRPAFDGRDPSWYTNPEDTVFSDYNLRNQAGCIEAPWPSDSEIEDEGSGRIATEKIHTRYLPLPRIPGADKITEYYPRPSKAPPRPWEMFPRIWSSPLDVRVSERLLTPEELLFRFSFVGDCEFTDQATEEVDDDGLHALGAALLAVLDPRDQFRTWPLQSWEPKVGIMDTLALGNA